MKDKKGVFILTIGVAIALVIGVLVLTGGLLTFITVNKFAVIGGGLIALVLIFGLRGDFDKTKATFMTVIIGLGILLILGGGFLQTTFSPPTQIYIDKDIGFISIGDNGGAIEQAFFSKTNAVIGDKITISHEIPLDQDRFTIKEASLSINLNGGTISKIDVTNQMKRTNSFTTQFTPLKEGEYDNFLVLIICNKDGTGCETSKSRSSNKLTVTSLENICSKDPYIDSWRTKYSIDGGYYKEADVYKVNSDCEFFVAYSQSVTQCDDGYVIKGSSYTSTQGEGHKCEKVQTLDDDEMQEYNTRGDECSVDFIETCDDGVNLVTKICVDNKYESSGLVCDGIEKKGILGNFFNDDGTRDEEFIRNSIIIVTSISIILVLGGFYLWRKRK